MLDWVRKTQAELLSQTPGNERTMLAPTVLHLNTKRRDKELVLFKILRNKAKF